MPSMLKKVTAPLLLASFLMVVFFSLIPMSYELDGRMQSDCPFSATGAALCPQGTLPGAIHHLFAYQSLINVPVNFDMTTLILALLFSASLALVFSFRPPIYKISLFIPYHAPPFTSHNRKITRWLSLFELSPSR